MMNGLLRNSCHHDCGAQGAKMELRIDSRKAKLLSSWRTMADGKLSLINMICSALLRLICAVFGTDLRSCWRCFCKRQGKYKTPLGARHKSHKVIRIE